MSTALDRRNARIVELVQRRKQTLEEIGRAVGLSAEQVRRIAAKAGVRRCRDFTEEEKAQAVALYAQGVGVREIGRRVGRPRIEQWLIRAGYHKPRRDTARRGSASSWLPTEDRVLERLYPKVGAGRLRVEDIATKLGRTRNQLIGRAWRLGLSRERDGA